MLPGTGRTPDGKSIPTARTATDADYASIGAPNPRNGKLLNGLTRGINIGGAIAGVAGNVASLFGPGGHKVGSRINGYNDAFQKIGSLVVPASNMLRGFVPKGGSAGNKMM